MTKTKAPSDMNLTEIVQYIQNIPGNRWNEIADIARELQAIRSGWQPIETAPHQKIVLVHYRNSHDKSRIIKARYVPPLIEELHPDNEIDGDYSDADDEYYLPAGWYEQIDNWDDFSELLVSEVKPDAWMPLPPPPEQKQEKA